MCIRDRVSREEPVFQKIGLKAKVDLFVGCVNGVTIYEAKAGKTKALDLYQLRMYVDGCAVIRKYSGCIRASPEPWSMTSKSFRLGWVCSSSKITDVYKRQGQEHFVFLPADIDSSCSFIHTSNLLILRRPRPLSDPHRTAHRPHRTSP